MAHPCTTTHVLYLHGFRSSPQSAKSRIMARRVAQDHPAVTWWCPQLPPSPRAAMDMLVQGTADWPAARMAVVGSSLGGYYADWLAEQRGCKAVLLNPAVFAARDLAAHVGVHPVWHDPDSRIDFTATHVEELRALQCAGHAPDSSARDGSPSGSTVAVPADPSRYFLLAAKGDAVLDWREMVQRYPGASLRLLEGGDHGLSDFEAHLDAVMQFLDCA